jgi:hypothetical protein
MTLNQSAAAAGGAVGSIVQVFGFTSPPQVGCPKGDVRFAKTWPGIVVNRRLALAVPALAERERLLPLCSKAMPQWQRFRQLGSIR